MSGHKNHVITSMVVDHFHILRADLGPAEADPLLVVDSDAVLPSPITPQGFQAIPWRHAQVIEKRCGVKRIELLRRLVSQFHWEDLSRRLRLTPEEQILSVGILEAANHIA